MQGGEGKPLRIFRIALTGDFLDESGAISYGDAGLGLLEARPDVRCTS